MFFSEEKNQKTLFFRSSQPAGHGLDLSACDRTKVFCFFSSEKKTLP
jgi:hypothetical protein